VRRYSTSTLGVILKVNVYLFMVRFRITTRNPWLRIIQLHFDWLLFASSPLMCVTGERSEVGGAMPNRVSNPVSSGSNA
jgi:hypothetical protein